MTTHPAKRKKLGVPRPWGHEQFLTELVGNNVMIDMTDEMNLVGKLLSFDRYSLLIERRQSHTLLLFKSAITSIARAS